MTVGRVFDACREDVCSFCPGPGALGGELCAHSCHAWGETNAASRAPAPAVAPPCPRCGGRQLLDLQDEEFYCLPCGGREIRARELSIQEERYASGKLRSRGASHAGLKL